MRTLTDNPGDFLLINLGLAASGGGPFSIRKDGIPPGSPVQQEDRFFLNNYGEWHLNFAVLLDQDRLTD